LHTCEKEQKKVYKEKIRMLILLRAGDGFGHRDERRRSDA